ncbi:MAG: hypothetical protein ACI8W7_003740 [Gammaproteobacteria bacterium]|jgi:hypothetical protein
MHSGTASAVLLVSRILKGILPPHALLARRIAPLVIAYFILTVVLRPHTDIQEAKFGAQRVLFSTPGSPFVTSARQACQRINIAQPMGRWYPLTR